LTSRHEHPGKMPLRNLIVDGCAWAACGKSLASKQTALGTRGSSVNKRVGSTTTRFPTGCAGPWKTLVSIRWCRSYEMREQKRVPRISTASLPQPLYPGRGGLLLLLLVLFFTCQSSEQEVLIDYRLISSERAVSRKLRATGIQSGSFYAVQDAER
jgi:hypothetical protein